MRVNLRSGMLRIVWYIILSKMQENGVQKSVLFVCRRPDDTLKCVLMRVGETITAYSDPA